MKKKYLMAPGPTPIPEEVLQACGKAIIHHRSPEFMEIFKEVNEGLKYIFQTKGMVYTLTSSGTGAMEASVVNLLSPGDTAIAINSGKFGERWVNLCKTYKANTIEHKVEWGKSVNPDDIAKLLKEHPETKAVYSTHNETSTGATHDIKALAEVTKNTNAVLVVDAISSLGAMELRTDEWGIDVVVTGSQKALLLPPGLAFMTVSEKAWKYVESCTTPNFYFSLKKANKSLKENDTPFTPAASLIIALKEAIKLIKEEGIENIWKRHAKLAEATRQGVQAIGLKLLPEKPGNAMTAVWVPDGVDGKKLLDIFRLDYGITLAGGQDQLKGKIFRIAHLGYADTFDVITAISALEIVLTKLGYKFELGKGVGAAEKVLLGE